MESSVVSRQATEKDLGAMTETLVLAFADDPVWGGWAFPDRDRAMEQRRAFFGLWLSGALRYRAIRVTENCEAVAAWYPPEGSTNTAEDERRLVSMAHSLLGDRADLFLKACELIEASQPQERPHYYLSLLGTHDDHRGKGLGMGLLKENLAMIDALGMPAFLESTNRKNDSRYERLGFARTGSYALPGAGPRIDMLWREPGADALV